MKSNYSLQNKFKLKSTCYNLLLSPFTNVGKLSSNFNENSYFLSLTNINPISSICINECLILNYINSSFGFSEN